MCTGCDGRTEKNDTHREKGERYSAEDLRFYKWGELRQYTERYADAFKLFTLNLGKVIPTGGDE